MDSDDTTDETVEQAIESSEKGDAAGEKWGDWQTRLEEMEATVNQMHDNLDGIKRAAESLNGEIEQDMGEIPEDLKPEFQRVNHMAVMAYQRVDRGDHQIVRGI